AGLHLTGLPDELIKPGRRHNTVAVCVRIGAVIDSRRLAVDCHLKTNCFFGSIRTEDQMQVTGAETVDDAAALLVQLRLLRTDGPAPGQAPFVETRSGDRIGDCSIGTQVLPRRKIGGALVTKIGLARADVLQVGACFRAFGVRFYCSCRRPVAASFAQQLLNRLLGSAIIAFSEMMMANLAFG